MAVESPPWALQAGSYPAEQTRRAVFAWAARTAANAPGIVSGGLLSATDCQLSAPGSGLSTNVSTGELIIPGNEGGTQGAGYGRVSSTTNLVISTANPSLPRIDTICGTMSDAAYTEPTGGSGSQWALQVVTGTATSGANLTNLTGKAALPGSSLLLGYVLVPAAASNIITADTANVATPVLIQSRITGAAWIIPTLVNSWANVSGFETVGYLKDPFGFVHLKGVINTGTSATVAFVLPAGFRPGGQTFNAAGGGGPSASAAEIATNGNVVAFYASASTVGLSGITFLAEN